MIFLFSDCIYLSLRFLPTFHTQNLTEKSEGNKKTLINQNTVHPSHTGCECKLVRPLCKIVWRFLKN